MVGPSLGIDSGKQKALKKHQFIDWKIEIDFNGIVELASQINEPKIRFTRASFWATDTGQRLGSLSVMDRKTKTLNSQQTMDLRILAQHAINLLALRQGNLRLQNAVTSKTSELTNFFDRIGHAFLSLDKNWNYTYEFTKFEIVVPNSGVYKVDVKI